MRFLPALRRSEDMEAQRDQTEFTLDGYAQYVNELIYNGNAYFTQGPTQTQPGQKQEAIGPAYRTITDLAYKSDAVVFACMQTRARHFNQARFQFRRLRDGRLGDYFGNPDLRPLETPWVGGTTQSLLTRMIMHVDLGGNAFVVRRGAGLALLRPDWVTIIIGSNADPELGAWATDAEVLGYVYSPGGYGAEGYESEHYLAEEVAHFAPIADPIARFRGMSWLTPLIREVMADKAATESKLRFFENPTPNMVVKFDVPDLEQYKAQVKAFKEAHAGPRNAFKWMFTTSGVDATPVGANMQQLDFRLVTGAGEPLALDTPVPTPDGWTTMGEIEPGDFVFGRDKRPARVAAVSPIHYERDCYRVTFSDRTSIVSDGGHIWSVLDRKTNRSREITRTTFEMCSGIAEWRALGQGGNRYGVPAGKPVELDERDLLVDPYVLGVWLGDGQTAGASICGAQPDLDFIAGEIEARGYTVTRWTTKPGKVGVIGIPGGLLAALDALGVLGNKHIPSEYLRASLSQRLDLLRGLMDTDGSVGSIGKESCEFSSKWEHLARQAAELSRSLGYRSTISHKLDERSRTGETWRLTFRADPDVVPFLLERKAERCVTPVHVKNRAIVSIEPVASVPVRCIAVETPDHLFRAGEGWTLTHNTRIAAAAGTPPVIVGLSEGLQGSSLNTGNYQAARRNFVDGVILDLWNAAAGSLANIINVPSDAELATDPRDISFLKEDAVEQAEILQKESITIRYLVDAGYKPDTVIEAVTANDLSLLEHSGLFSVQLQAATAPKQGLFAGTPIPNTQPGAPPTTETAPATNGNGNGKVPAVPARSDTHVHFEPGAFVFPDAPASPDVHIHEGAIRAEVTTPDVHVDAPVTFEEGSIQAHPAEVRFEAGAISSPDVHVDAPITVEPATVEIAERAFVSETTVEPAQVTVEAARTPDVNVRVEPAQVTVESPPPAQITVEPTRIEEGAIQVNVEPPDVEVTVERAKRRRVDYGDGRSAVVTDGEARRIDFDDGDSVTITEMPEDEDERAEPPLERQDEDDGA